MYKGLCVSQLSILASQQMRKKRKELVTTLCMSSRVQYSVIVLYIFLSVHRCMLMRMTLVRVVMRIARPQVMLVDAWHVESSV